MLTAENYYSPEMARKYYSVSQVKQFIDCEAAAMAELHEQYRRPETQALLVGGFVDAYFSGEMEQFIAAHPQIIKRDGGLKAEFVKAQDIIARLERDPLAMRMMDGDRQAIITGEIAGLPFKAKFDFLLDGKTARHIAVDYPDMDDLTFADGAIVDLKIVKDFKPLYKEEAGRMNFIEFWQYDLQLAVYQELYRQKTGHRVPCYILAATKEDVTDIRLFRVPQEQMDTEMELLLEKLPHIDQVKQGIIQPERCEDCAFCRESRVLHGAEWAEVWA